MRVWVAAILLLAAVAPGGQAKEPGPLAGFNEITTERLSRHVPWGVPLQGGPIRALFVAPRFTLRDVVELSQRLDLDYAVVPVWDAHHLGGDHWADGPSIPGSSQEETLTALYESLRRDYDLIVIGNVDLAVFPQAFLDGVVEKVAGGAGLLLAQCGPDAPEPFAAFLNALSPAHDAASITRGIGEAITPEWPTSLAFVKAAAFEEGRVVQLDYCGERPFTHFLIPALTVPIRARLEYFDAYLSLVAKAARWAAGRQPPIWVVDVEDIGPEGPQEEDIPPGFPEEFVQAMRDQVVRQPYRSYRVHLSAPAAKDYAIRVQVREPSRNLGEVYAKLPRLRKGERSYSINLPIGSGTYFVDLWLLDKKKVVAWHTEVLTVHGWPDLSETDLVFSKGFLLPNDTLSVAVNIERLYHEDRPCTVYARATDSLGRVVAENTACVGAEGGRAQLTLGFADLMANLVKVDVFAADAPGPQLSAWDLRKAAYGYMYLPVRAPRSVTEYSFAIEARAVSEYNARGFLAGLVDLGLDAVCCAATDSARFHLAEANLNPIPRLTRYAPENARGGSVREPCLTEPTFRDAEATKLKDKATGFWTVGSRVYSLGSANCIATGEENLCQSSTCLDGFRNALQSHYGTLSALNAAWKRDFASWDSVVPDTREAAAASGVYPPWLDFRRYMDTVFAGIHVAGRDVVRAVDLDARVGFRAAAGSSASLGYDWWRLASELDALAVPPDPVLVEKVRSYRSANAYAALCFGGAFTEPALVHARWLPWYQVLHGIPALWCIAPYGGSDLASPNVAVLPDGRPSSWLLEVAQQVGPLKSGLGTLLANAKRKKAAIAIYGSQASAYLNQVDTTFASDTRRAEAAFVELIEGLSRQCDFVSYAQAARGKLSAYSLLILPMARALSDTELDAIKTFGDSGGHVIADVAPGQFDEHGAPRASLPLDDLFGIRRQGPVQAGPPSDVAVAIAASDDTTRSGILEGLIADTSVQAPLGIPHGMAGDTPVWIEHRVEDRPSVLLNHPLSPEYVHGNPDVYALFETLLDLAAVEPIAAVSLRKGAFFEGECVAVRYGKADIVALLAAPYGTRKRQKLALRMPGYTDVYDLVDGARVPGAKKMRVTLQPSQAAVYAGLPYEVSGLGLTAPDAVQAGRRLPIHVTLRSEGESPGEHLVHLSIARAYERPVPHYEQDLVCTNGEGETYIPLALNERRGTYTLRAREVLTGISSQTLVRVLP